MCQIYLNLFQMASSDENFHEWNQLLAQRAARGASMTSLLSQTTPSNSSSKMEKIAATVRYFSPVYIVLNKNGQICQQNASRDQILGRRPNAALNTLASQYPSFNKHLAKFVHGQVKRETETACRNLSTVKPQVG